jgi:hypothetical protein
MTGSTDITFVLTSGARFDLLAETLRTFLASNTAPISRYVIVDDSGGPQISDVLASFGVKFDLLINDPPARPDGKHRSGVFGREYAVRFSLRGRLAPGLLWRHGVTQCSLPVRVRQALQALPRVESIESAPPARTRGYQRPLSCLRIDELQASSFAGASEDAISSS